MLHCTAAAAPALRPNIIAINDNTKQTPVDDATEMNVQQTQNLKNENWSKHVEGINFPPLFVHFQSRQCLPGRMYEWLAL